MYFPKRFELGLALELGKLVECAYAQFDANEHGGPWRLPDEYCLLAEIKLPRKVAAGGDAIVESLFKKVSLRPDSEKGEIPIGFIAQNKKRLFIIFRGTQTAAEWISNLKIRLSECFIAGRGNVHDGFQNTYLDIRNQITAAVNAAKGHREMHIAGHSLGAALAAFAACDIEFCEHRTIHSLYTFGSPRIGDDAFAQTFNSTFAARSFRIINSSDIVTEIPLPAAFLGFLGSYFSHTDTPVMFNVQTEDIEKNHRMRTYVSALEESKAGILKKMRNFFRGFN